MQAYLEMLLKRQENLLKCVEWAENVLSDKVDGHLSVTSTPTKCEFYRINLAAEKKRLYIPKTNMDYVKALATSDYAARLLRLSHRELKALERYISVLERGTPETVYSHMTFARRELVKPLLVSDEILEQWWTQEPFVQSTHMPENKIYPTKKGDMVRSKSEVFFADTFLDMGLSYRYEQVLNLHGVSMVPDFSLWDRKRRREVYLEHFGLMDDPDYRQKALRKIDVYRRNGIYVGKNLITTFEGNGSTLNMREMKAMFTELFL